MQTFALKAKKAALLNKDREFQHFESDGRGQDGEAGKRIRLWGRLLTSLLMDTTRCVCWASVQSCESSILCRYISNSARA